MSESSPFNKQESPIGNNVAMCANRLDRESPSVPSSTKPHVRPRSRWMRLLRRGLKSLLPDALFLFISHRRHVGRFPNLWKPVTFNEMILRRCLSPDPRFAGLTDKLEVRQYVERKVGSAHLIPLVAVPEHFTPEVFDALPQSFVMKANHGSGLVEIVRDKSLVSFERLRRLADEWLSINYYRAARERHYKHIKPRIYFEALLLDSNGKVPADLKFHCFSSRSGPAMVYPVVISDRFGEPRCDFFDARWNRQDIAVGDYPRSLSPPPRPANLASLIDVASSLSADFDYVRVDLYALGDRILVGELTFTPGAGVFPLFPDVVDYEWGRLFKRAERKRPDLEAQLLSEPRY